MGGRSGCCKDIFEVVDGKRNIMSTAGCILEYLRLVLIKVTSVRAGPAAAVTDPTVFVKFTSDEVKDPLFYLVVHPSNLD